MTKYNLQSIRAKSERLVAQLEKSLTISIISISDFKLLIKEQNDFLRTHFTPEEINYCKNQLSRLAARYLVKNSLRKVLGKHINWRDISILASPSGEPVLVFSKNIALTHHIALSITHEDELVACFLSISKNKDEIAVGLDITRNSRITAIAKQLPILQKILTKEELQKDYTDKQLAKIWTGKEAISKALGIGIWHGGFLQKIQVLFKNTQSEVKLLGDLPELAKQKCLNNWKLDFVQDEEFTLAFVVAHC